MVDFLRSALAIVFVFGIVVFIHELGHFLAAKAVGVYAPRFSIGFGPAIWSRKWGETEYQLALLPLGGFVRMATRDDDSLSMLEGGGEHPAPEVHTVGANDASVAEGTPLEPAPRPRYWDPNAMAPFGPKPIPEHRLFESKPLAARLLILVAGVTMNIVLGFVVLSSVLLTYGQSVIGSRTIGGITAPKSAPQLARALAVGDTVRAVDGRPVTSWDEVYDRITTDAGSPLRLRTQRAEVEIPVGGVGEPTREEIARAIQVALPPVIDLVVPGSPASKSGLERGDSIVAVSGTPIRAWSEVVDVLRTSAGQTLQLTVMRHGAPVTVAVRPEAETERDPETGAKRQVGRIGAGARALERRPVSLGEAVTGGWRSTLHGTTFVLGLLRDLATGRASPKMLGGPIQIASQSAQAAKEGFDSLLELLALLSINLAVFNMLPIPLLDGGQILLNVAEAARGRAFSDRTRQWIAYVGLAAIALLVSFALFNDTSRLFR